MASLGIRKGVFWSLIGQFGYLAITLFANIVLARILSPADFGQLGIVLFFIVIARSLSESGLGGALVRNNNVNDSDYSTIFIFNLVVSLTLCLIIIGSSSYISEFYKDQALKKLLIVSSFILIINAFQFVQNAKIVKFMRFKEKAIYEFIAISIAATVGILLAINDFGVWSLVVMQLLTALIITALLWIFEGGHGALVFSKSSFKYHYKFGMNTSLASILSSVFDNIYQLILGKYFSISQTGLYYQANKLQEIPVGVVNKLTQGVIYSGLSKIQDDHKQFMEVYRKVVTLFTVAVGLICFILFIYAREIIFHLYGEKWVESDFFLKTLALSSFFYMQEMFNRILFKVYNRTEVILKLEFVKKGFRIMVVIIGLWMMSIEVLMYGFLISSSFSYFINYIVSRKVFINTDTTEMKTMFKVIIVGVIISTIYFFIKENFKIQNSIIILLSIPITSSMFLASLIFLNVLNWKESIVLFRLFKN
jgi:teichuronic acid exporter